MLRPIRFLVLASALIFYSGLNAQSTEKPTKEAKEAYKSGVSKMDLQQYKEAISDFTLAIKDSPNYTDAYYKRGLAEHKDKDFSSAAADFNEVIKRDPSIDAYFNLASAEYEAGNDDKAIDALEEEIPLFTARRGSNFASDNISHEAIDAANLCTDIGIKKVSSGDDKKAMTVFNDAITINPWSSEALYYRAVLKMKANDNRSALNDLDKAILCSPIKYNAVRISSKVPEIYYARGCAREKEGFALEAVRLDLDQAINRDPKFAKAYLQRGQTWVATYDWVKTGNAQFASKAIDDFSKAIQLDPTLVDAYVSRGQIRLKTGDNNKAAEDFGEALKRDAGNADAKKGLELAKKKP